MIATRHGVKDAWGRPLGVDFSGIWVAGHAVLEGHPALPYDNAAHAAAQLATFGVPELFLPWPYPPFFLAIAAGLASLPYLVALLVWQGLTLPLYLLAVAAAVRSSAIGRPAALLAALAFPAVAINLVHGQNGFLSAGLLGLGGLLLPRRPIVAGVLLGLLAYKPHLFVVVPVAMLAAGCWRAACAAAVTFLAMTVATLVAFGPAPWLAFAANLAFTRQVILEGGGIESYKLQSAFAAVRLFGGPLQLAYAAQGLVAAITIGALAWLWRGDCDHRLKVAGLSVAAVLATPYVLDYDLVILGPAIAALAAVGMQRGFISYGKTLLAVAWAVPLGARVIACHMPCPIGFMMLAALYGWLIACAAGLRSPTTAIVTQATMSK